MLGLAVQTNRRQIQLCWPPTFLLTSDLRLKNFGLSKIPTRDLGSLVVLVCYFNPLNLYNNDWSKTYDESFKTQLNPFSINSITQKQY